MGPLPSAMMAPALPAISEQYNISSSVVLALTLSIFLLSFALGVRLSRPLLQLAF